MNLINSSSTLFAQFEIWKDMKNIEMPFFIFTKKRNYMNNKEI